MIRYKIKNTAYLTNEETGETLVVDDNETIVLHTDNPIESYSFRSRRRSLRILKKAHSNSFTPKLIKAVLD